MSTNSELTIETTAASITVDIAQHSIAGKKAVNEDAVHAFVPQHNHALINKGIGLMIADGVSSAEAGKEASHYAVTQFIEEYFKTPDTWSVKQAGQKTLSSINLNLFKKSHEFLQQEKGYLCTFSGVVIKSRTAYFFHAGDSRIYHIFKNEEQKIQIKQVTRDHAVNIGGGKNILSRAVGMDNILQIDFGKISLNQDDILLLTTDGIHDFMSDDEILQIVNTSPSVQDACEQLVEHATANKSDDNITCLLCKINELPQENRDDFNSKLTRLPFPPDLEPGMKIDGFEVVKELFASSRSQVYLVTDTESGKNLVMKTPSINFQDDVHYIDRFIQEEWIGKRIKSEFTVNIVTQNRPRTFLYYLMELVPGISLDKWMLQNPLPTPKKAIGIVKQIAKALAAFHATETIHQDLKPANIMIDENLNIKVIDFGSVFVAGIAEIFMPIEHLGALGTATYSDPYYLQGKNTGVQGDIYALATITYELFTGKLPYSEKIEQCVTSGDFDKLRYIPASTYNPIIPLWFDRAIEKGVSLHLPNRYRQLSEFVRDVTAPNPEFLQDDPVIQNSKGLMFWQLMSAFWIFMLIIVVVLFSTKS
ncbi:MAG: serine/threonine protein phosphatase PrpC [Glaciecola sp.]